MSFCVWVKNVSISFSQVNKINMLKNKEKKNSAFFLSTWIMLFWECGTNNLFILRWWNKYHGKTLLTYEDKETSICSHNWRNVILRWWKTIKIIISCPGNISYCFPEKKESFFEYILSLDSKWGGQFPVWGWKEHLETLKSCFLEIKDNMTLTRWWDDQTTAEKFSS